MADNKFGCLGRVLLAILILSVFVNVVLLGIIAMREHSETPKFEETLVEPGKKMSRDKIAMITLHGVISSSIPGGLSESMVSDQKIAFRQAVEDEAVKAIVLYIDSPGGEVTASDMIYNAVREARSRKPVVVYMGSLAASGGYYVSCGGTHLMASDTTLTGSIGVIIQTLKYKQLFDKIGMEAVVFKSGEFKDILSGTRDMTPEEKEYLQKLVMQMYGKFVGIVATERKIPEDELRKGIADGRIVSGLDALPAKLVDQLGSIENAYQKARELGKAENAKVVRYTAPFSLSGLFRIAAEPPKIQLGVEEFMPKLESGKIYLLPSFYLP